VSAGVKAVSRLLRRVLSTLIPCVAFVDHDVLSVLADWMLEHVGKMGGEHGVARACEAVYKHQVHVLFHLLRRPRSAFALEAKVVMQRLLALHQEPTAGSATEKQVKKHRILWLERCGISSANLSEWLPLFLLCRKLVLADNSLERASLRKAWQWLQSSKGGCFTCFTTRPSRRISTTFNAVDVWETTPSTPDVALELMIWAVELDMEITLGNNRQFKFSDEKILNDFSSQYLKSADVDVPEAKAQPEPILVYGHHPRANLELRQYALQFLTKKLQAVSNRSAPHWDDLKKAFDHLQLRHFDTFTPDFWALFRLEDNDGIRMPQAIPLAYTLLSKCSRSWLHLPMKKLYDSADWSPGINRCNASGGLQYGVILPAMMQLCKLDLHDNEIGVEGGKALAEALKTNTSLQHLVLDDNEIGEAENEMVTGALKSNREKALNEPKRTNTAS